MFSRSTNFQKCLRKRSKYYMLSSCSILSLRRIRWCKVPFFVLNTASSSKLFCTPVPSSTFLEVKYCHLMSWYISLRLPHISRLQQALNWLSAFIQLVAVLDHVQSPFSRSSIIQALNQLSPSPIRLDSNHLYKQN